MTDPHAATADDGPDTAAPMPAWRRSLIVLWLTNLLTAVGLMVMLPFFPLFLRELGETDPDRLKTWSGVIVGAAPFTAALTGGLWGAIGDQLGRRNMVIRAMLGVSVFVGLMAFAERPWHLLLLRIGQGCFSGFAAPTLTLASVIVPGHWQGRVSSRMQTAILAGSVIGPLLGAELATRIGFRGMVSGCALLSLLSCLLVRVLVPEPPRDAPRLRAAGTARGGVVGQAFADVLRVLRDPRLQGLFVALLLVRLANSAQNPTLVLYIEELTGTGAAGAKLAGRVFAANPIAVLILLPMWGRIADLGQPLRLLMWCAAGGALFTFAQAFATSPLSVFVLRFLGGAAIAGVFPAGFAMVASASRRDERGSALGTAFSALAMGLALGPFVAAIVDPLLGYRILLMGCAALLCAAALVARHGQAAASSARPRLQASQPPVPSSPGPAPHSGSIENTKDTTP